MLIGYARVSTNDQTLDLQKDALQKAIAQALYNDKNNAIDDICKTLRISRSTLYRYTKTK